jgi:hypothetical protein
MKMINNKKGLSDVVTTVLIILIGLAAVAAIGAMVINQINKLGTKVDKDSICRENVVDPISCTKVAGTNTLNVAYTRVSGEAPITGTNFNIEEAAGFAETNNAATNIPSPFLKGTSSTSTINYTLGRSPQSIELVTTYTYKGSDTQSCTSLKKVSCN